MVNFQICYEITFISSAYKSKYLNVIKVVQRKIKGRPNIFLIQSIINVLFEMEVKI